MCLRLAALSRQNCSHADWLELGPGVDSAPQVVQLPETLLAQKYSAADWLRMAGWQREPRDTRKPEQRDFKANFRRPLNWKSIRTAPLVPTSPDSRLR
jgi:hypothetical protein